MKAAHNCTLEEGSNENWANPPRTESISSVSLSHSLQTVAKLWPSSATMVLSSPAEEREKIMNT